MITFLRALANAPSAALVLSLSHIVSVAAVGLDGLIAHSQPGGGLASEKLTTSPGQTPHMAFWYDALVRPECGLWGAQLALNESARTESASIRVDGCLNSYEMVPPQVWDLTVQAVPDLNVDTRFFPTARFGFPAMSVRTDVYLAGGRVRSGWRRET